jgi:uncharacterized membrane protein
VDLGAHGLDAALRAPVLQPPDIRRAALHHALLSYLFGTVIVAVTVSTVAGHVT